MQMGKLIIQNVCTKNWPNDFEVRGKFIHNTLNVWVTRSSLSSSMNRLHLLQIQHESLNEKTA